MAEFNLEEAQRFQDRILEYVRGVQRMLDTEVSQYYRRDRVDNQADARENLRGLHNYLKRAYRELDRILTDIENRADFK